MKCKTCGTDHRGVAKHGGYCLDHQEQRAESAEVAAAELERHLDLANAHAARLMQERDEARRQLSEAQTAIDAMAQIVGAADEVKHQLEQARSDIEDYRIRVNELFDACEAARDWFARNTKQGHTPGPVEKMLIDAISKAEVVTA